MFKSFQDTSALQQFHAFPNLNMQQATSAYGFSGVTFWLDAAYGLNTQTNLGAVSRWQARVGGSVFEQATAANQPRLVLSDANYNNLPSVQSVDTSRIMNTKSGSGLRFNNQITVAVISKIDIDRSMNYSICNPNGEGIYDGGTIAGFNGFGYGTGTTSANILLQGTTESTNPRIKIVTSTNIIVNGVNEATGTINRNIELTRLFQGATTAFPVTCSIAEIIAFGYAMTSDEAIALSNNLNQKYAIY